MADPTRHATRSELFERFALLGVEAPTVQYLAHKTVEEGQRLRVAMAGTIRLANTMSRTRPLMRDRSVMAAGIADTD